MVNIRQWFNDLHIHFQLLILLTWSNIADFTTTKFLVDIGGYETEVNPLMFWLISSTDTVWSILWTKLLAMMFIIYLFWRVHEDHVIPERTLKWGTGILIGSNALYFGLVCWNMSLCIMLWTYV